MSDFLSRVIPAQPLPATLINPRVLVIYKDLKVGSSTLAAWLSLNRNAVWLDLERGSGGFAGRPVDVMAKCMEMNPNDFRKVSGRRWIDFYLMVCEEMSLRKPLYDYLVVDKLDQLETWADEWAVKAYSNSVIGKGFAEPSIGMLEKGAGWGYLHDKFQILWNAAKAAARYVIFIGTVKTAAGYYDKHEAQAQGLVASTDLDLGKRQRKTAVGDGDATALMWRENDGCNWVSFVSKERGAFTGNRIPRLEGTKFRLSWPGKYMCCGQEIGPKDYPQHLQSAHQGVKPVDLRMEIDVAWNNLYVEENGVPK